MSAIMTDRNCSDLVSSTLKPIYTGGRQAVYHNNQAGNSQFWEAVIVDLEGRPDEESLTTILSVLNASK